MTNSTIASIRHLSHKYSKEWAIFDLCFDLPRKGIVGLLGSNGAGKSTFMNILCGVLTPTSGRILIDGIDVAEDPLGSRKTLGFLPQKAPLYTDLTVDEYLRYCAKLRKVESTSERRAIDKAKSRCGIAHFSKRLIRNLSGGYQQRVGIAQAILHNPSLVVLDEPTNGLDPNQIVAVRELIREISEENSVILSTHILPEVQVMCSKILMIERGRIAFDGSLEDFNSQATSNSLIVSAGCLPSLADLKRLPGVVDVERIANNSTRIRFDGGREIGTLIVHRSVEGNWGLEEIRFERTSLDDVFSALSKSTGPNK